MIIGFKVNDPRLRYACSHLVVSRASLTLPRFPPKNTKTGLCSSHIPPTNLVFPSSHLAESEIWDDSVRNELAKPRFKKKDLDQRRAKVNLSCYHTRPVNNPPS
jgi:ribonuclease P/MRP protein subunit POP1